MEDGKIISLFWARDERAIDETKSKYGAYCRAIAYNILSSTEDAEECENDTYIAAWGAIPPERPMMLRAFLGKITRNIALKKHREKRASKRGGGTVTVSLGELEACLPDSGAFSDSLTESELGGLIDSFLRTLSDAERRVFVCRYWYCDSIAEIAKRFGYGQSKVKMMLSRTRGKLKEYLEEEGAFI